MTPPAPGAMAPGADPAMGAAPEQGGYCIEIYVRPDGTFKVAKEMKPEPAPMPGEEPGQEMTADNIGDALKLVIDILEREGSDKADNEFDEGFGAKPAAMGAKPGMPADM